MKCKRGLVNRMKIIVDDVEMEVKKVRVLLHKGVAISFPHEIRGNNYEFEEEKGFGE